jgi:hypothetical protein
MFARCGSFAQLRDELADGCGGLVGLGLFDEGDDGAADDGGVGELTDGFDVFGVGDQRWGFQTAR